MARRPRQTLDYLIDLFTPEIRDAFLAAIQGVVDDAIIADMITAIENGDPAGAFQALGFSPAAMRPITAVIERAFERGGVLTGDQWPQYLQTPSGRAVFRFDVRNSRAEAWLRDHSSALVTRLTDEARDNVRTTLERGMIDGRNPRNVALDIVGRMATDLATGQRHRMGGVVGLTANQEGWVARARRELGDVNTYGEFLQRELRNKRYDSILERAIRDGRPLPADTVEKIITAYKDAALKWRGESIARTEAIQALNRSEWEATMQAVDIGALRRQDVKRHWDSAGDSRVRWSHKSMDAKYQAEGVGIDEPFVSPSGARMMHPGDTSLGAPANEVVMCRCRVRMEVDFLAQWNDEDDAPTPTPPVPPIDLAAMLLARNRQNDERMRQEVVSDGMRDTREHLRVYNALSGDEIKVKPRKQTSSAITFDDDLVRMLNDRNNSLVLHHNHPNGNSFSKQDLNILNRPGAAGIWAHGHNGASYYAERGTRQFTTGDYERIEKQAKLHFQSAVNNRVMSPDDANKIFYHVLSSKLNEFGMIKYSAQLPEEINAALQRNEAAIRKIMENLK